MTDAELLRRYTTDGSGAAFGKLVERHLNLVYSVARRHAPSSALAEDVAQSVFIELARHARRIDPEMPLVAWLHVVSRRTALNAVRSELRRQVRETAAAELESMKPTPSVWADVEPLLDEAVETLAPADRSAILLRFFENKSLRDVGTALGTSEDTAQKRVSRAVEQLRAFFLRRGVTVTAARLATDLSAHAILTAPAALGTSIATATLSGNALSIAPAITMTLIQKILVGTAVVAVLGIALHGMLPRFTSRPQITASTSIAPSTTGGTTAVVLPDPVRPEPTVMDPASPAQQWDQRVALLRQLLAELPAQRLPELKLLTPSDWIEIARTHELDTAADIRVALADLRAVARKKFAASLQETLRRFTDASGGQLPTDLAQLAPYLTAPADAEMLARYDLLRTGKLSDPAEKLLREKPTSDMLLSVSLEGWNMSNNFDLPPAFGETDADAVDRARRALNTALGEDGKQVLENMSDPQVLSEALEATLKDIAHIFGDSDDALGEALKGATKNFLAAHPGETVTDLTQIQPYLKDSAKIATAFCQFHAQMEYSLQHDGQLATDPAQLRPYLANPYDATEALRALKLKWDGEHITMSFELAATKESVP